MLICYNNAQRFGQLIHTYHGLCTLSWVLHVACLNSTQTVYKRLNKGKDLSVVSSDLAGSAPALGHSTNSSAWVFDCALCIWVLHMPLVGRSAPGKRAVGVTRIAPGVCTASTLYTLPPAVSHATAAYATPASTKHMLACRLPLAQG